MRSDNGGRIAVLRGGIPARARPALLLTAIVAMLMVPLLIALVIAVFITLNGGGQNAAHVVLALVVGMLLALVVLVGAGTRGLALWQEAQRQEEPPAVAIVNTDR